MEIAYFSHCSQFHWAKLGDIEFYSNCPKFESILCSDVVRGCFQGKLFEPFPIFRYTTGLMNFPLRAFFSSMAGKSHFKTNPNKIKYIKNFLSFEIKLEDDTLNRKSIYLNFTKPNNSLQCTLKVVDFISLDLNHHNCLRMPIKRWIIH